MKVMIVIALVLAALAALAVSVQGVELKKMIKSHATTEVAKDEAKPCKPLYQMAKACEVGHITHKMVLSPCHLEPLDKPLRLKDKAPGTGYQINLMKKKKMSRSWMVAEGQVESYCCKTSSVPQLLNCELMNPQFFHGSGTTALDESSYKSGAHSGNIEKIAKKALDKGVSTVEKRVNIAKIKANEADSTLLCRVKLGELMKQPVTIADRDIRVGLMERTVLNLYHQLLVRTRVYSVSELGQGGKNFKFKKTLTRVVFRLLNLFGYDAEADLGHIEGHGPVRKTYKTKLLNVANDIEKLASLYGIFNSKARITLAIATAQQELTQFNEYKSKVTGSDFTYIDKKIQDVTASIEAMEKELQSLKAAYNHFMHEVDTASDSRKTFLRKLLFGDHGSLSNEDNWKSPNDRQITCPIIDFSIGIEAQAFAKKNRRNDQVTQGTQFVFDLAANAASAAPMGGAAAKYAVQLVGKLVVGLMKRNDAIRKFRRELRAAYIAAYQGGLIDSTTGNYKSTDKCVKQAAAFLKVVIPFIFSSLDELDTQFAPLKPCVRLAKEEEKKFERFIPVLDVLSKTIDLPFAPIQYKSAGGILETISEIPKLTGEYISDRQIDSIQEGIDTVQTSLETGSG